MRLPAPEAWSVAQVEKNNVFAGCMKGMKMAEDLWRHGMVMFS
jgi:hypothetical protein